jgi:AbrB family looped-hinge helix DNA binding protein
MARANGVKLKVDKSGRIVLPKPLRVRMGLRPGTELEAVDQPDGVLLRKTPQRPALIKVRGILMHQGVAEPGIDWDHIVDSAREERIEHLLKSSR